MFCNNLEPLLGKKRLTPSITAAASIDGVLLRSAKPIAGAADSLALLKEEGIPFILLTNGGGKHESERVAEISEKLGVPLDESVIIQSHSPFAELVHGQDENSSLENKRVLVVGGEGDGCRRVAERYVVTFSFCTQPDSVLSSVTLDMDSRTSSHLVTSSSLTQASGRSPNHSKTTIDRLPNLCPILRIRPILRRISRSTPYLCSTILEIGLSTFMSFWTFYYRPKGYSVPALIRTVVGICPIVATNKTASRRCTFPIQTSGGRRHIICPDSAKEASARLWRVSGPR